MAREEPTRRLTVFLPYPVVSRVVLRQNSTQAVVAPRTRSLGPLAEQRSQQINYWQLNSSF